MGVLRKHRLQLVATCVMLVSAASSARCYKVACTELSQYVSMTDQILNEASYSYRAGTARHAAGIDAVQTLSDENMEDYITHMERARASLAEVWRSRSCTGDGI